ncbi:MAG: lipocalin family protein [Cytophagaceae bacterium]|nr:lipocalin family protein [Cytophagaceae bacterium]
MNRFIIMAIASGFAFASCEKKTTENSGSDSLKTDTVQKADTAAQVKQNELTGKSAIVAKSWKATEIVTPTTTLSGELADIVGITFNFKPDGTFEYTDEGKKGAGQWKLNKEETALELIYDDQRGANYEMKELKDDKLIISGMEHDMKRTLTLAPAKK